MPTPELKPTQASLLAGLQPPQLESGWNLAWRQKMAF